MYSSEEQRLFEEKKNFCNIINVLAVHFDKLMCLWWIKVYLIKKKKS